MTLFELSKALAEKGYPRKSDDGDFTIRIENGEEIVELTDIDDGGRLPEGEYLVPTTDGLLEALGDEFEVLEKENEIWFAFTPVHESGSGRKSEFGKGTPLEALCNLFLKTR